MKNLFTDHPKAVGENYFQHFCYAMKFSLGMFRAGFACWVHALFPFWCQKTATNYIAKTACKLSGNGRKAQFAEQMSMHQQEQKSD
jgi:hypothetical protein